MRKRVGPARTTTALICGFVGVAHVAPFVAKIVRRGGVPFRGWHGHERAVIVRNRCVRIRAEKVIGVLGFIVNVLLRGGPVAFHAVAVAFRGGPVAFHAVTVAFRGGSVAFRGGPVAFRGGPVAFRGGPVAC